jgi:glycosyltransferase involved in cell wall biosynthesis
METVLDAPRISIVVPNFNSGPVLRRALDSILNQTYKNFELIVVDSLSTDEALAILDEYRDRMHVCIREKDTGHANGLNKGFARATGDIYCWLCADDELKPNAFETVARVLTDQPEADFVTGGCERVFSDGSHVITRPPENALQVIGYQDFIEQPSTFWRAGLHRRVAPLDERDYYLIFDWELWCRMRKAGARPAYTPDVLSVYYFSGDNKTSRAGSRFAREARRLLRRYGPLHGLIGEIYWLLYRHFDLHGCYDTPPACSLARGLCHRVVMKILLAAIGEKLAYGYNWNFASKQARGLKWW